MATKKTTEKATTPKTAKATAAPKAAKVAKAKAGTQTAAPRHPLARVKALHGSKEGLVSAIIGPLVGTGDTDEVKSRLLKASNHKLLHLAAVVDTVNKKFGGRDKLIASIGAAGKKAKDQDYLTKLGTLSLPQLLDLANASARRAKHA